jgi:hypothetical protein
MANALGYKDHASYVLESTCCVRYVMGEEKGRGKRRKDHKAVGAYVV